jgi:hypothetical protein
LTSTLIQRFNDIAPASAVLQYESFATSQRFEDILLRECSAVGADRKAFDSMEACVGWLVELVDRKEADLQGMVADAHPPPGFLRGRGSAAGNNCLISSIAQALLGTGDQSQGHIDVCANIRRRGAGLFWDERSFIEASEAALAFICDCLMEGFPIIHMTLHCGHDGGNCQEVRAEGAVREGPPRAIHLYNPVGVHFDPLFPLP